jgi:peptidoglycan/LPS O-acetylase OafA/YrhL
MYRTVHPRRRRRREDRVPALFAVLVYAALLLVVNVAPSWEAVPFFTSDAASVFALVNVSLVASLVAQTVYLVDDNPRLLALGAYVISLINVVLIVQTWKVFPFDFGTLDASWAQATRMVLAGCFAWALYTAARAAVRLVRGRNAPRLAATRA